MTGALGSITRHVGDRPAAPTRPDSSDETLNPHFWIGTLAASIHGHLHDRQPHDRLERDWREFMDSPCCDPALREMLER